jgi:putative ATPase
VKDIREVVARAEQRRDEFGYGTILFIDEIHRFSRSQQDALLPHVEAGTVTLIGATTENPSFEVNAPLLSRARVLRLESLGPDAIGALVRRALERELPNATLSDDALAVLVARAEGDARRALNALEVAASIADEDGAITEEILGEALQQKMLKYDRSGEEHYNVVSAFIKSLRGSDADAAVYWMARMLEAGEDPRFVMRRLVIFASEDVGNADPQALVVAEAAHRAYEFVGMPEGVLPMTQAALYLARAPKSNEALTAYATARKLVREHGALPVPDKLRNAPTKLMKDMGYGRGYKYPHDFDGNYVKGETYLPDELAGRSKDNDDD